LGIHHKPVGLLCVAGYYQSLMEMIDKGVEEGFISPANKELIIFETDPAALIEKLRSYKPPRKTNKWSELEE